MRTLTAVDLFCGAGGFTEGFKQEGIRVSTCLDIWSPAVETHLRNHPETKVVQDDLLEFSPDALPDCDILIGSPPCTEFSYANRGGHGDLGIGMRLVLRFLRFVHEMRPRYWIMENVPRLFQTLPPRVHLRRLGVDSDGFLEIPVRRVLNAADYGTPQKRLRLISGQFPIPEQTHSWEEGLGSYENLSPWLSVHSVVDTLPDPLGVPRHGSEATDPCYDLKLPEVDLTDHFMDTRLSPDEVEINRKSKTDHSWYGRMAFPDPLDRPARTVMATQTGISRETLVIDWRHKGRQAYRRPTIRECASFQSFPISYQFWGSTAAVRYKLVGNAVPPLLASALARGILKQEGVQPRDPVLTRRVEDRPSPVTLGKSVGRNARHSYPETRKFRDHLPGSKSRGVRIDFANVIPEAIGEDSEPVGVRWEARLVAGSGKRTSTVTPGLQESLALLIRWSIPAGEYGRVERLLTSLQSEKTIKSLEADSLQASWAGRGTRGSTNPPELLKVVAGLVDREFPAQGFEGISVELPATFPDVQRNSIGVRRAAQLTAVAFTAEAANARMTKARLDSIIRGLASDLGHSRPRRRSPLLQLADS